MSPKKTPKDDAATPAAEPTPPPAVDTADPTLETPAASAQPTTPGRTRGMVAAGAAGLLLVGGAAGFGIGRATGDDDGPRFNRTGQFLPGEGQDGQRHPGGGSRDQRNGPPMPDRDGGPGGRMDDGDFPPAPGAEDDSSSSGT